jgi:hypothetical protein
MAREALVNDPRRRLAVAFGISLIALVVSAGTERGAAPGASLGQVYQGQGLVLQSPRHAPALCLGSIATSLPPQCTGIPIRNWSWDAVSGEHTAHGSTWASYHVVGTYDGTGLTLTRAPTPPSRSASPERDAIGTPCPAPIGGWQPPASPIPQEAAGRLQARISNERDFSGDWLDWMTAPSGERFFVFNAAFTGDLDRHRAELDALWNGPLCVTLFDRSESELQSIQHAIYDVEGLQILDSDIDTTRDQVICHVVTLTPQQRAALDVRFGVGAVRATAALTPVA